MNAYYFYAAVFGFLIGVFVTSLMRTSMPEAFVPLLNTNVSLTGTIVTQPDIRESSDRLTVEIEKGNAKTKVIASTDLRAHFRVGDNVRVSGILTSPEPFASDGGRTFQYNLFLAKDGVFGIVQPAQVSITGRSSNVWLALLRELQSIKDFFVKAITTALPQPESALAIGIIAGGKQGLGKELLNDFTIAGMLQIVVLSGYNVMIVAEGVLIALTPVPKRIALIIAGIVISLFVLTAGAGTSAIRAGIMAVIALTARGMYRTYNVLRALFVALIIMLLWNPLLLVYDPGLELSFLATLGLILLSKPIEQRLAWIGSSLLREMLATTLAAQVMVLPLLLYESGNLSVVAIPANILAMPVLPAAMGFSVIAAAFASLCTSVPVVVRVMGVPAYLLLTYVIHIAEYAARMPFANFIIPAFSAWWLIPAYGVLGYIVWKIKKENPQNQSADFLAVGKT